MLSPTTIAAVPPPDGQVRLNFSVETVPALLDDQTKRFPDRILLITEDEGLTDHTITYHQFKKSALHVGAKLLSSLSFDKSMRFTLRHFKELPRVI